MFLLSEIITNFQKPSVYPRLVVNLSCMPKPYGPIFNAFHLKANYLLFHVFQLTKSPVNVRALAILSTVAGDALTRHLRKIIPAMLQAVDKSENETAEEQVITHVIVE